MSRQPLGFLLYAAALLAALWFTHRGAFDAPFYFDTVSHLETRSNLHLSDLSLEALSAAVRSDFDGPVYRPLAQLSLALTHLGFGLAPRAYRVGNLLIHWAASLTALFLCLAVLRAPRVVLRHPNLAAAAWPAALIAATLWALHPVHTNLVSYVVQRMASLSGLFSMLAVACYLRGRSTGRGWSWGWAGGTGLSFAMALASKESGVLVPLFLVLSEACLLAPPRPRERRLLVGALAGGVAVTAALGLAHMDRILGYLNYGNRPFTLGERLLTEARLQGDYLSLLLLPLPERFVLTPDVEVSTGLLTPPGTLVALLLIAAGILFLARWGRRFPLVGFALEWYGLTQLLEATIIPLELYFEHRLYLPLLGVTLLVGAVSASTLRQSTWGRPIGVALLAGAVLFLGWSTQQRTAVWADPVRFWTDAAEKAPGSARAHTNLGRELARIGRLGEARASLQRALELHQGKDWITYLNLARVAFLEHDAARAEEYLKASIAEVEVQNWEAPQRLGLLALRQGQPEKAEHYLRDSLRQHGSHPETWRLLAAALLGRGDLPAAEQAALAAVRYGPTRAETWNTLGAVQFEKRDLKDAQRSFAEAVRLAPGTARYTKNLEMARAAGVTPP